MKQPVFVPTDIYHIYYCFLSRGLTLLLVDGNKCFMRTEYGSLKNKLLCILGNRGWSRFCRKYGIFARSIRGVF